MISDWPGYQQVPGLIKCHNFKFKVRSLLTLVSMTILMKPVERARLKRWTERKGTYKHKDILILGNGPSIRNLDFSRVKNFQMNGGLIAVMNDYSASSLSEILSPNFYFLADPEYWRIGSSSNNWRHRLENYLNEREEIVVCQPCNRDPLSKNNTTLFFDFRSSAGLVRNAIPNKPWGYPASIAMVAIACAQFLGFKRIYFAGLDSTSYANFYVNEMNELRFSLVNNYFEEKMHETTNLNESVREMRDWPIRNLSDVHYAQAIFLRDLRKLCGDNCINVGLDQTNDSAWRACLI